jgi:hypothetical protein
MCNVAATIIAKILGALRYNMYRKNLQFLAHVASNSHAERKERDNGLLNRASHDPDTVPIVGCVGKCAIHIPGSAGRPVTGHRGRG